MQKLVFGLLAAGMMSGALPQLAFADQVPPSEAKLATAVSEPRRVVIDGRTWRCSGDVCKAGEQGTDQPPKRECGKLAKEVGQILNYTNGKKDLSADDLAACNAAAKS